MYNEYLCVCGQMFIKQVDLSETGETVRFAELVRMLVIVQALSVGVSVVY